MNTETIFLFVSIGLLIVLGLHFDYKNRNKPEYPSYDELEAIEFAEWIADNDWIRSSNDLWFWQSDGIPDEGITTVELYKKFKEQLNENS